MKLGEGIIGKIDGECQGKFVWDMIRIHSVHVRINLKYTFKVFYKLTIKEIKIKITLKIHFTPEIMASIKKSN